MKEKKCSDCDSYYSVDEDDVYIDGLGTVGMCCAKQYEPDDDWGCL